ncbi:hypothetical protein GGQ86_003033 [Xanthobacter flavus]|uniref:Uncharacterized protein n=1 Tax=Xanthobacter flavus TaxID=281 RepID=A0A9W6FKL0_XANFL|nr:hypothetical protein [Xanthobacter flavus]MDR6334551.1 hypothetical protein [Xanthobacter flavus]GLI23431.1 hypothetical protein XFLAVUS301_31050 [Xanthobacter flavus]
MAKNDPVQQSLDLYASLMDEVKVRIGAINQLLAHPLLFPFPIRREFGFLQLRMICELVALGCLVAHEDIKATQSSDLRKKYAADEIINRLSDLHSDFFPTPHVRTENGRLNNITPKTEPYLTKDEMIKLVRECGDILHKGSLKKLIKPKYPIKYEIDDLVLYTNKLIRLLESHHINRLDGRIILCILKTSTNGDVSVAIAEPLSTTLQNES